MGKADEVLKRFEIAPDGKSIKCLQCNRISHHPQDVKEFYCGRCHRFLKDEAA